MYKYIRGFIAGGIIVGVAHVCGYIRGVYDHIQYVNRQETE